MNNDLHVSVIMPCRNEARHIEPVLEAILTQKEPPGGFEVIVADGLSNDGTRERVLEAARRDARVRLVDNPDRFTPQGLNAAIRAARGDIIVRMDAHTVYAQDYIQACVAVLKETRADNAGGAARTRSFGYVQQAIALAYHSRFSVGGARFHDAGYEGYVDTVTYGCWPKATFEKYGFFDEELVRNQDDEHNLRITRGGGKIWQSRRITSWYVPRGSLTALFRQYFQYGYWKVRVIQKHRLPASIRHLVPGGFVAALLVSALAAPCFRLGWLAPAGLLGLYACANLAASLITCRQPAHWKFLPVMPPVFAAYHFGYGWGFLRGVVDFVLLRRGGRAACGELTR